MKISFSTAAVAVLLLSACEPAEPTEAQRVIALPSVSYDSALAQFEAVCLDGSPDIEGDPYIFKSETRADGKTICTMRARAPEGTNAFQEFRGRFGPARSTGAPAVSLLINYPRGDLLLLQGAINGAGEGTYQLGIVRG